jgi:ABC-type microcin C transport system permease subunit YejE
VHVLIGITPELNNATAIFSPFFLFFTVTILKRFDFLGSSEINFSPLFGVLLVAAFPRMIFWLKNAKQ